MADINSAAIFDLDGTLIPHTSAEITFFFHLFKKGNLSIFNLLQMIPAIWTARGNLHEMTKANKRYLRNKRVRDLQNTAQKYFEPQINRIVFPRMVEIIEDHRNCGNKLLLLTGTLDLIAECFVRVLGFDGYRAATLEIVDGRYTGRITGILPYGIGKLEVLRDLKNNFHFDRDRTSLYANVFSDRYVMNAVERPVAVNPDAKLRIYARKLGWEILDVK
ncbi:MAG TPA: HAD-IB family hydrolase [Chitinispirillaceae bacterium]|nr:HAD-IB family hydrolase [Chitinispirillaceae bacterium]